MAFIIHRRSIQELIGPLCDRIEKLTKELPQSPQSLAAFFEIDEILQYIGTRSLECFYHFFDVRVPGYQHFI